MAETVAKKKPNAESKPKKNKLSKAERMELARLAALQLKRRLIREHLVREIELHKKSRERGKIQWEKTCKEIKISEFRKDIEGWSAKSEHLLEKKDEKIDILIKTIEETQDLHERSFSNHLEQLNYLRDCHKCLTETATTLYETQASEMIVNFLFESTHSEDLYEKYKLNSENVLYTTNILLKERLRKNYEEYMDWKFNEVATEIEKRYIKRNETCQKMKNLQENLLSFRNVLQGDLIDTHKTSKFDYFMERQASHFTEFKRLSSLERAGRKTIIDLQQELLSIESEASRKIYGLKLEQAYFLNIRSMIKRSIALDKQITHNKLLVVASQSYEVLNKLKDIVKRGEFLLSLSMCCRKFMTENEKVIAWDDATDSLIPEPSSKMKFDLMKHLDLSEEELDEQMTCMKNFWQRCSSVMFHNILLVKEKRKLIEENEKYRNLIRSMKKSDDAKFILESIAIKQV